MGKWVISLIVSILILGLITINDASAVTENTKLTASDAAGGDRFGVSVSISGDTAIVGSHRDGDAGPSSGSAYVFGRDVDGTDNWGQVAKLTASDAAAGDQFGISVSISGDTAIVGSIVDNLSTGSAYVFERDAAGVWAEQAKLTASDAAGGDQFGVSVSISGDTAIVGSHRDDDAGPSSGSAYVFGRDVDGTDNWGQVAKLTASDAAAGDRFGVSVSISGDTAIVGAHRDDDAGSAYVFERDAAGVWAEQAKLTASDAAGGDQFGVSVSISGDTALVGANFDDDGGSAYVFVEPITGWLGILNEDAKLTASDATASDQFGVSVSISGDTALVGAHRDDDGGSAYVFVEPITGWLGILNEDAKLTASDATASDQFGVSVSISGDTILVGANFDDDDDAGSLSGSAYVDFDFSFISVEIDIKPGNDDNCYKSDGSGHISVAIFGSVTFDVTTIDPFTISLDSQEVKTKGSGDPQIHIKDVNGDGFDDLESKIIDVDGTYEVGDDTATLTAQLFDGTSIMGSDFICIRP